MNDNNIYAGGGSDIDPTYDFLIKSYKVNSYGTIDTSAGTNSKKVGIATSATSILIKNDN